jgi:phospholipase C
MTNCHFKYGYVFRSIQRTILALGAMLVPVVSAQTVPLPPPEAAGFEHVLVVMMENRSFDHFFGWFARRGRAAGGINVQG